MLSIGAGTRSIVDNDIINAQSSLVAFRISICQPSNHGNLQLEGSCSVMLKFLARPPAACRGLSSLRLLLASTKSSWSSWSCGRRWLSSNREGVHDVAAQEDKLDRYIGNLARKLTRCGLVSISDLYAQYSNEAGVVLDRVVPYEEQPQYSRQAHVRNSSGDESDGDGIVLVVHAQWDANADLLSKTTVCSGFVVDASINSDKQGDTIVTCAHTLEEVRSRWGQ